MLNMSKITFDFPIRLHHIILRQCQALWDTYMHDFHVFLRPACHHSSDILTKTARCGHSLRVCSPPLVLYGSHGHFRGIQLEVSASYKGSRVDTLLVGVWALRFLLSLLCHLSLWYVPHFYHRKNLCLPLGRRAKLLVNCCWCIFELSFSFNCHWTHDNDPNAMSWVSGIALFCFLCCPTQICCTVICASKNRNRKCLFSFSQTGISTSFTKITRRWRRSTRSCPLWSVATTWWVLVFVSRCYMSRNNNEWLECS